MHVLVGYASRHESTPGVAERIGARLREAGARVDVVALSGTEDAVDYDAIVFGSAVYSQRWLPPAVEFARRNDAVLRARPVWTFTVGRLRDQGGLLRRVEWPDAKEAADLERRLHPRSHRFFSGAIERSGLSRIQWWVFKAVGGRFGDFRNWPAVDAWADRIARELSAPASPAADA
jgi:menaquinone-dependent protoporphyrinogen oxidase